MSVEQLEVTATSAPDGWNFGSHAPGEEVAAVATAGDGQYIGGRSLDAGAPDELRFALADVTAFGDGDTISEVRIIASLRDHTEGGSAGQFKSRLILGGSISDSAWTNSSGDWTNYAPYSASFAAKPGGGAWTRADVDALEVGLVAHSPDSDISNWHIDRLYVEIEYTVVPVAVNETDSGAADDFGALVDALDPDEAVAGSLWLPQGAAADNLDAVLLPHDDDAKYTRSPPTAFRYLLFKLEPHALDALRQIEAVTLHARVRSPSGGTADFLMTVGGVELTQGAGVGGAAWKNVSWRRTLNPNGDPWAHSDLDALEFGLVTGDGNEDPVHVTTLFVEIEHTQIEITPVGEADAAAGADSHALAASVEGADAAAAVDGAASSAELPSADAGAAAEGAAVAVADADAGAAAEGISIAAELASADSGAAFETHALAASVADADAGNAQDSHALAASVADADAAAGADSHALAAAAEIGDAAAGDEGATVGAHVGDAAAGAEAASLAASLAAADSGAGADAEGIAAQVSAADAAAGEDAAALAAAVAFAEAAAFIEIAAVALAFGEAAAGAEGANVAQVFGDEAAGADSAALALALADSCAASESVRRIVRSRRGRAFAVILSGTKARG